MSGLIKKYIESLRTLRLLRHKCKKMDDKETVDRREDPKGPTTENLREKEENQSLGMYHSAMIGKM